MWSQLYQCVLLKNTIFRLLEFMKSKKVPSQKMCENHVVLYFKKVVLKIWTSLRGFFQRFRKAWSDVKPITATYSAPKHDFKAFGVHQSRKNYSIWPNNEIAETKHFQSIWQFYTLTGATIPTSISSSSLFVAKQKWFTWSRHACLFRRKSVLFEKDRRKLFYRMHMGSTKQVLFELQAAFK